MSNTINKENSVIILSNSVRMGQKMGAYILRESNILKKAIDFFNPDVTEKPDFGGTQDPEIVAVNLLLQGVQKAQAHGGEHAYSIDDAALLWDIMEFWMKEGGKAVAQNVNVSGSSRKEETAKSSKPVATSLKSQEVESEESEDEDDSLIKPMTMKSKGKGRQ